MLVLTTFCTTQIHAQSKTVKKTEAYSLAVAKLKRAIEANPDNVKIHEEFIDSINRDSLLLTRQYKQWIEEFPASSIVPYAIAKYYISIESPKAKPYLLKAIAKNPKLAEAWYMLSMDAERWGRFTESQEYLQKAIEASPENPDYSFYYAVSFMDTDHSKFIKLGLEFVNKFPKSNRGAQVLYWMGFTSSDIKDKIQYFDLAVTKFPVLEFDWSGYALSQYYEALLIDNPKDAVKLATNAIKYDNAVWSAKLKEAKTIDKASDLLAAKKGQEALALIADITFDKRLGANKMLISLKAQAYALQGMGNRAYQLLIETFLKSPSPEGSNLINEYGKKLGKDEKKIKADIWQKIDSIALPAHPFTLKKSIGLDSVSLSEYKGNVVLLTYWFPGCGPCRAEFPHFENVIKKINNKKLVYLALNIIPGQIPYIMPFLKKTGYSFLSLEDPMNRKREKGNLDNRGAAPVNFLIDKQGRVIFSNFSTRRNDEDDLELMIRLLLDQNAD